MIQGRIDVTPTTSVSEPEKIVAMIENTKINKVAKTGAFVFLETFLNCLLKKKASSLAIAYMRREPDVIETVPQPNIEIKITTKNTFPKTLPRLDSMTYGSTLFDANASGKFLIHKVVAIKKNNPKILKL